MAVLLLFMIAGGLAVGAVYSAMKLWGDAAAGRYGLGRLPETSVHVTFYPSIRTAL